MELVLRAEGIASQHADLAAGSVTIDVYNTQGLNERPEAAWIAIDEVEVKAETIADVVASRSRSSWSTRCRSADPPSRVGAGPAGLLGLKPHALASGHTQVTRRDEPGKLPGIQESEAAASAPARPTAGA
ncbi:uncharacterized protein SOCE26_082690 [Sorangium cellulosum]|uniref:Uncharacterized protein n=1 Tax=Sorangium cellulosum TaxID=56 RepID=A0A2L0F5C1_SORCE|nr:uncharacterized protein SOCE26_082690 [Sorangium cellulosum]